MNLLSNWRAKASLVGDRLTVAAFYGILQEPVTESNLEKCMQVLRDWQENTMDIRSKYKASSVNGAAVGGLLAVLLSVVIIGLQSESLLAHENTLSSYTRSLRSEDPDQGALNEVSASDQTTDSSRCRLTLNLIDAATKESLPGLVRATTSDGRKEALEGLLNRGTGLRQRHPSRDWYVILKSTTVSVPRERLRIEAFSGLETELARKTIDLTDQASAEVTLPLVRFHRAATSGWRNGNTHLHLMSLTRDQADQYLKSISRADGLELVFVSYLRRAKAERNYISNTYTKQQLQQLSGHGVMFGHGEEHRHNFGSGGEGYGHVMFPIGSQARSMPTTSSMAAAGAAMKIRSTGSWTSVCECRFPQGQIGSFTISPESTSRSKSR